MPILPRAPRRNKVHFDMLGMPPRRDPLRHALRTIITLHRDWSATVGRQSLQDFRHLLGGHRPGAEESQPLPHVLIQHRQALQSPPIRGLIMNKGLAPDMMGMHCTGRRGRARAHRTPWPLCLNDLEALALSDTAHRLTIDTPVFTLQQVGDFPISKAWLLRRQCMHTLAQLGLIQRA